MTKEEFVTATEIAFEKLMSPSKGIRQSRMEEPMAEGTWSFKDLAAHLIFWDTVVVRALEEINQGREFDWNIYAERDRFNREAVERSRPLSPKRVMNELRVTHSTVTEAVRRVSDEKLMVNGEIPEWLVREVTRHYVHHTAVVEVWASRVKDEEGVERAKP